MGNSQYNFDATRANTSRPAALTAIPETQVFSPLGPYSDDVTDGRTSRMGDHDTSVAEDASPTPSYLPTIVEARESTPPKWSPSISSQEETKAAPRPVSPPPAQPHPMDLPSQPSAAKLEPPASASNRRNALLSPRSSAATLVPQALGDEPSPKPGAGQCITPGTGLAMPAATAGAPALGTLPPMRETGASGSAVKSEAGLSRQKLGRRAALRHFIRIFSFSSRADRLILAVSSLAAVGSGAAMPCMNIVFGRVFASFTGYYHQDGPQLTNDRFRGLILECVHYLVYLFAARCICCYIAYLGFRVVSMCISATIRLRYLQAVLATPVSRLDAVPPGRTAAMVTALASTLQQGISERAAAGAQAAALVVAALAIALAYSWELTLVAGAGVALVAAAHAAATPAAMRAMDRVQACEVAASATAAEALAAARMLAAYGAEESAAARYDACVDRGAAEGAHLQPVLALQYGVVFFAVYATLALCFWYALRMYVAGRIAGPETLVVVLLSVMMLTGSVSALTMPITAASRAASAAAVFFMVLDAPQVETSGEGAQAAEAAAAGDIELARVNFAYPARPLVRVLDGLSVRFVARQTTAIVGPSGAGKSTVVALLERWYEMDGDPFANAGVLWLRNGIVTAGGRPLRDLDLRKWRAQIGLVQQEPFLFNESIFRNVAYGLVGTEWEDAPDNVKAQMVKEACRDAYAEEFIGRLPESYNTFVGDAGFKLSGGQRQRLAIARAIVRRPKILILDEATSAIDVEGEKMVQAALDKASQNRTTIIIAHRLSAVRRADNIIVMRQGRAVEQGSHEELMAKGGLYHALAAAQQLDTGLDCDEEGAARKSPTSSGEYNEKDKAGRDQSIDVVLNEESRSGEDEDDVDLVPSRPRYLRKKKFPATPSSENDQRGFWASFFMLLREQMKHWPWYLVMGLGALGGGASPALQAYLFANLVALFQLWGDLAQLQQAANFWCLMFVMLAIGVGISYFALAWSSTKLSFYIIHHYRKEYIRNMLRKCTSFFDHEANSTGALTARLATDPTQLQQLLGMNMGFVLISVLAVVGCLAISFYFGWKLTAVTVVTTMPLILGAAFFRVRYEKRLEQMGAAVFSESAKFAVEAVGAFRTVSSLTLEQTICERYRVLLAKHIREALPRSAASTALFALSDSISLLCMAFVLWYGGNLMADHEYLPFQYVVVYIAVLQGGLGAGQWLSYAPNIAEATLAANRIIDMRDGDEKDGPFLSLDRGDLGEGDMGVKLEFKNVWFRYPTRDAPVLNGLDLTIEKGQFAAIVGPSGSGKTTIISLLERFYEADTGRISYNGLEISHLCLRDYRREISLVAQEPFILDGTIRENVLLGVQADGMAAGRLEAVVVQACRDAEMHDFIASLPEGYDSGVGAKGVALSGGQKQRLSIARALARNPRLLLLDEATSNLDSDAERAVQAVFEKTRRSRTMVVVAHRLATVQNADVIFVLGGGRVVEKGDHATLLRRRGIYYRMCRSQALDQ